MKIAIIGTGNVGSTLGRRFSQIGHEVVYGVRDPNDVDGGKVGKLDSVASAAKWAELLVLAVPFTAAGSVLGECGDLAGKVIVDATNPLGMIDGRLSLTVGFSDSGAEQIAKFVGNGKLVKCFNQTGFGNMAEPRGSMMFVCGDDPASNEIVRKLADDIGFEAIAIGDLKNARLLEPLAALWIHLSITSGLGRDFAFGITKK